MNKTSNKKRSSWKSMSNKLHPINIWTTLGWRKVGGICVKGMNYLKREGIGRRSPVVNCYLVKYIMLLGRPVEDRASPSVSWIGTLFGIQKWAQNYHSNKTLTGRFGLRCPTLVFFHSLCWGLLLPLVEATPPLVIILSGSRSCGNLCGTTHLSELITRPIRHLAVALWYNKKPRRTNSPSLNRSTTETYRARLLANKKRKDCHHRANATVAG